MRKATNVGGNNLRYQGYLFDDAYVDLILKIGLIPNSLLSFWSGGGLMAWSGDNNE
jgi:hypothetical protein